MKLTDIMNNNKIITKLTEKRRRRKAIVVANKAAPTAEEHTETGETASSHGDRKVRFGRDSVAVYDLPPPAVATEERSSVKDQLWYNKTELNAQFLKGLEESVRESVRKAQCEYQNLDYCESDSDISSRGLEFHFAQNQRRKAKAEAYVRAIVDKSYALHKEHLSNPKNRRRSSAAEKYADSVQEYCSQFTWVSRDLALGVAVMDEAEARAIYNEEDSSSSESFRSCTSIDTQVKIAATSSKFIRSSRVAYQPSGKQLKRLSYNAVSA